MTQLIRTLVNGNRSVEIVRWTAGSRPRRARVISSLLLMLGDDDSVFARRRPPPLPTDA